MEFTLVPYSRETVEDRVLEWFWNQMEANGLHKVVFYSGHIRSANDFMTFIKTQAVALLVVDKETRVPLAMGWLTDWCDRRAFAHFCVLPDGWEQSEIMGRRVLEFWLTMFNLIMGMIPKRNTRAIEYVKRIGMTVVGEIPNVVQIDGNYETGIICYIAKENYNG